MVEEDGMEKDFGVGVRMKEDRVWGGVSYKIERR